MLLVSAFIITAFSFDSPPDIAWVRSSYLQAIENEAQAEALNDALDPLELAEQPVLLGYKGVAKTLLAKHYVNPYRKYVYFNQGKADLEIALALAPGNLELRYLRFVVQSHSPAFLGYRDKVEEDRSFIIQALVATRHPVQGFEAHIREFMLTSPWCTQEEKKKLHTSSNKT